MLEKLIRETFKNLPPLAVEALYPAQVKPGSLSCVDELDRVVGHDRYSLLAQHEWMDAVILYQLSSYGCWYFSPTFLIMMVRYIDRCEFWELSQLYRFTDVMLKDAGYRAGLSQGREPDFAKLDVVKRIEELAQGSDLTKQKRYTSCLNRDWFAACGSFYSLEERRVVAQVMRTVLAPKWPHEVSIEWALQYFWERS